MSRLALIAALCVAHGACLPKDLPIRPGAPSSPAQPSVAVVGETFEGVGGVQLFARSWRPAATPAKGVLVIVHGLRDHGDRYAGFAERLVAAGYAVYAADLRGHGRSSGPRVWVDEFDDYVADLDIYVAKVRAAEPAAPLFLMGHSMGGTIVTRFVEEKQPELAGAVLSAPALGVDKFPALPPGIVLGGLLVPHGRLPGALDDDDFSRDRRVVEGMKTDPLISHSCPPGTFSELIRAIGQAWDDADRFRAPLLIVHGTGDKVTPPAASRDFVAAASGDRTLKLYPGYWHDLLHEPGGEAVAGDITAWLDAHVAAAPAAVAPPVVTPDRRLNGDAWRSTFALRVLGGAALYPERELRSDVQAHLWLGYGAPIGWRGGVTYEPYTVAGFPAGVALRLGSGGQLAIAAGVGHDYDLGATARADVSLDVAAGPVKLFASSQIGWELGDDRPGDLAAGIDDVRAHAGVRLGRDHRIGRRAYAGAGPTLGLSFRRWGDQDVFGLLVGLDLWGSR